LPLFAVDALVVGLMEELVVVSRMPIIIIIIICCTSLAGADLVFALLLL